MRAYVGLICVGCGSPPAPVVDGGADADAAPGCAVGRPWAAAPSVATGPVQETAAVADAGRVVVIGGFDDALNPTARVSIFDPVACAWSDGPALPRALHHVGAAVVDDTIYVAGGLQSLTFAAVGDVWAWTPGSTTTWQARTAMPVGAARGAGVVGVVDGRLIVAGGLRDGAVAEVSVYDPSTDTWADAPPLPTPLDHACGGVLDGRLIIAGGRAGTIGSTTAATWARAADGTWQARAPMPRARGGTACGVVDGRLIVVGGEGNPDVASGVFPDADAYDPIADTWTPLAPMPTPRHGMAAVGVGDRLWVPGGADRQAFAAVDTVEVLTP